MKRGLTLVEVLVVAALIGVLAAILLPVARGTLDRSWQARCVEHLRQVYVATALYRTDHDGDGRLGSAEDMGLPPDLTTLRLTGAVPVEALRCPRTPNEYIRAEGAIGFVWMARPEDEIHAGGDTYARYVQRQGENAVLAVDMNHKPADHDLNSRFVTHHGLGVSLAGGLIERRAKGMWGEFAWWESGTP